MNSEQRDIVATAITRKVAICKKCEFHSNGRALPFFGKNAKYLLIGEAPHVEEIKQGTPFVGDSGNTMWKTIYSIIGLERDDFIILNSVMCKPSALGKSIGKPKKEHIDSCIIKSSNALEHIQKTFEITHILALGNYAKFVFDGKMGGIDSVSGNTVKNNFLGSDFIITFCIHPASVLYNASNKKKFEDSLISFKDAITFGNV